MSTVPRKTKKTTKKTIFINDSALSSIESVIRDRTKLFFNDINKATDYFIGNDTPNNQYHEIDSIFDNFILSHHNVIELIREYHNCPYVQGESKMHGYYVLLGFMGSQLKRYAKYFRVLDIDTFIYYGLQLERTIGDISHSVRAMKVSDKALRGIRTMIAPQDVITIDNIVCQQS